MATPNAEQKIAIEHNGGVLLKAGAGSGKTFVLKEHMIYLAKNWIREFADGQAEQLNFESFIKGKLRKIVLMTFTKKAAGELEIRLHNEFKQMIENDLGNQLYWKALVENLSSLNVSTIHGFCFKLIKMGFFPDVSAGQTILAESEYRDRISEIFDDYLTFAKENIEPSFYELLLKDKNNVFDSLKGIFADPTLRLAWKDLEINHSSKNDGTIEKIITELNLDFVLAEKLSLGFLEEYKGKKWADFLSSFLNQINSYEVKQQDIMQVYRIFKELDFKIPAKPSGKTIDPEIVRYYEKVRDLKDFFKKNGEHFEFFFDDFEAHVLPWIKMVKNLIDYVEIEYSNTEGVTFSDLEYIVYENLKHPDIVSRIQAEFSYFIVDEFQDTSFIQYSILKALIGNDYKRLFCVGDLKQAIYGFRGGELGVFLDCEKHIPQNLSLKNNYRSAGDVIRFNNLFFEDLFKLGDKYKGVDKKAVPVIAQAVPENTEELGLIQELQVSLDFLKTEEKLSNLEVDYYEALGLLKKIKEIQDKGEEVAILYKRLKPSLILMNLLMQEDIGFISQTKIPFMEDPIIGIFYALIEKQFNQNEYKDEYQLQLIEFYLNILAGESLSLELKNLISDFYTNKNYYGLYHAYSHFLEEAGLSNSQFNQNLIYIKTMIKSSYNDEERIYLSFKEQKNVSYSLDFYFGKNPAKVKIMTAHASKGLQFEHVLLGGMYTNENSMPTSAMIGKLPMSFKWAKSTIGKEKYKTPQYIYEEILTKNKELSENKRLFYVANTRAVKTLSWVALSFGELKRSKNQYNSWISGISAWKELHPTTEFINQKNITIGDLYKDDFLVSLENPTPFFHTNSLGVEFKQEQDMSLLLPELSVTRLATVSECPRKFYFQNICKLLPEEIALLESPEKTFVPELDEDELNSQTIFSSASRGTEIHQIISDLIIEGFDRVDSLDLGKETTNIEWVVDNLRKYLDKYDLISEKPIKFELLGYMISGIPDLIISPKSEELEFEIWDFKTGRYSEDKLAPYWFQLMCYAYSQYLSPNHKKNKQIKLVLCFVDEQKMVEKRVSLENVENFLKQEIVKTNQPQVVNTDKCDYCPYDIICKK